MNRRSFLASVSAFVAPAAMKGNVPSDAAAPAGAVRLKVGIVSDTHVAFRWQKEKLAMLKKVLRMFNAEKFEMEPVKCLFARSAAPKKRTMRVVVTPYNCWLKAGEPIISSNFNLK